MRKTDDMGWAANRFWTWDEGFIVKSKVNNIFVSVCNK